MQETVKPGKETSCLRRKRAGTFKQCEYGACGAGLSFSVREFKDIIKEMQNGVYGEDYRAVPGSTNMTYIMISQNRRENLKEGYRQLTGGISGNVSGGAGNGGMWIVPYFIDEREEVFPAGMTDSMDFTAWEVDRNDG